MTAVDFFFRVTSAYTKMTPEWNGAGGESSKSYEMMTTNGELRSLCEITEANYFFQRYVIPWGINPSIKLS